MQLSPLTLNKRFLLYSDHYAGLGSSWNYGQIYCTDVTARLAENILRVQKKWIVEAQFDVPIQAVRELGLDRREIVRSLYSNLLSYRRNGQCPSSHLFSQVANLAVHHRLSCRLS